MFLTFTGVVSVCGAALGFMRSAAALRAAIRLMKRLRFQKPFIIAWGLGRGLRLCCSKRADDESSYLRIWLGSTLRAPDFLLLLEAWVLFRVLLSPSGATREKHEWESGFMVKV